MRGGSPTVRRPYTIQLDDPRTTNDESNDQPVGYFGTVTIDVYSEQSGNEYILDADCEGTSLARIYFPKGGWIDFSDCELESDLTGECQDEEGRTWEFRGESYASAEDFIVGEENSDRESSYDEESEFEAEE